MGAKKQRRLSQSAVFYVPVSVILIVALFVFGISVFLKVHEIEVEGSTVYTVEDILSASGITPGENMLFMNVEAAEKNISSDKPYIKNVKISRRPPSGIHIEVTESTALGTIIYQDKVLIIDSECRLLKITDSVPDGLIEVRGFTPNTPVEGSSLKAELGDETQLDFLIKALVAIEKEGIEKDVSYLDISIISKINFGYMGRFKVILGGLSNARSRISQLPEIVTKLEAETSVNVKGEIDLSDTSGDGHFTPNK